MATTAAPITRLSMGIDLNRIRAYFASGPNEVPAPERLIHPGPVAQSELWPLVARRNLKRLLVAMASARIADDHVTDYHRAIIALVMALSDAQLDHLFTEPELTSWLAGLKDSANWDGLAYLDGLAPVLVSTAALAGVDCDPLPVAVDKSVLSLRPLGLDIPAPASADVWAQSSGGCVEVRAGGTTTTVRSAGERWTAPGARELPRSYAGAVVKGLPEAWLRSSFPDLHKVSADRVFAAELAERTVTGMRAVDLAWPEMGAEISTLLRWIVPMAEGDSFFVPAFRGLVALPPSRETGLALNVVHELSHNIMSCVYDLVTILDNPDERVRSPFSREVEPLSSVIHSCWAFSHELRVVRRMRAAGLLDASVDWDRLLLKIKIFYDRALPVIRAHAVLSPYGRTLLDQIESIVYTS